MDFVDFSCDVFRIFDSEILSFVLIDFVIGLNKFMIFLLRMLEWAGRILFGGLLS